MSMSNESFARLCREYEANWGQDSWGFRDFAESLFPSKRINPDSGLVSPDVMKAIRKEWKSSHGVWYQDSWEAWMSIEAMPFGGWEKEKDEVNFLKGYRKVYPEGKTARRAYMRTFDPEWEG